jgi:transcriptional regulator with XRE-family HTH domain
MKLESTTRAGGLVGARIRTRREAQMISQQDLAKLLGVTPAAVCQWETKGTSPRFKTLKRVAEVLHVSADFLSTGQEPSPSPASADSIAIEIERVKAKVAQLLGIDSGRILLEVRIQK